MKQHLLVISLCFTYSEVATAQWLVQDAATFGAINALFFQQQLGDRIRTTQHWEILNTQKSQHEKTLKQWTSHLQQLRKNWDMLNDTRQLVGRQMRFVEKIRDVTGDPGKMTSVAFQNIDREVFSQFGILADISAWIKGSKSLSDWGRILESIFEPLDSTCTDKYAREKIRKLEDALIRIKRRQAIEQAYMEAEKLRSQTRTLRSKLKRFLGNLRLEVNAAKTNSELQKVGLKLTVTEKAMQSAIGIGEDIAKRLMELKTLADNRDALEEELQKYARNSNHKEAAAQASDVAKKMYQKSRIPSPRMTVSGTLASGRIGKIRSSVRFGINMPSK